MCNQSFVQSPTHVAARELLVTDVHERDLYSLRHIAKSQLSPLYIYSKNFELNASRQVRKIINKPRYRWVDLLNTLSIMIYINATTIFLFPMTTTFITTLS